MHDAETWREAERLLPPDACWLLLFELAAVIAAPAFVEFRGAGTRDICSFTAAYDSVSCMTTGINACPNPKLFVACNTYLRALTAFTDSKLQKIITVMMCRKYAEVALEVAAPDRSDTYDRSIAFRVSWISF